MNTARLLLASLLASTLALPSCGPPATAEPAAQAHAPARASAAPLEVAAEPAASASAPPASAAAVPRAEDTLPMHRVGAIYSLIGLEVTGDGLELKLGFDPGGGALGHYRYVPLVGLRPDLDRETEELSYADTTMYGLVELVGRRPRLIRHSISGFRSAPSEGYAELEEGGTWGGSPLNGATGMGAGIQPWTGDRLLELRLDPPYERTESTHALPSFRLVGGAPGPVPTLPRALARRLEDDAFRTTSFLALESGAVVAVGRRLEGHGALVWDGAMGSPRYVVDEGPFGEEEDLRLLGGRSIPEVRLLAGSRVLRLEGERWVEESIVEDRGVPDVWFGRPLVLWGGDQCYARMRAGEPFRRLPRFAEDYVTRDCVATRDGVIWLHEDDVLYGTEKPPSTFDVSEAELVARRKKSFLRGGSHDPTGSPLWQDPRRTCSAYLLALDVTPKAHAPADYPALRRALAGRSEPLRQELVVFEEGGLRFAGVFVSEYGHASDLRDALKKARLRVDGRVECAEPPILRRIPIAP